MRTWPDHLTSLGTIWNGSSVNFALFSVNIRQTGIEFVRP